MRKLLWFLMLRSTVARSSNPKGRGMGRLCREVGALRAQFRFEALQSILKSGKIGNKLPRNTCICPIFDMKRESLSSTTSEARSEACDSCPIVILARAAAPAADKLRIPVAMRLNRWRDHETESPKGPVLWKTIRSGYSVLPCEKEVRFTEAATDTVVRCV